MGSIENAVAGFLGGAVSTLILHPLDLIKVRLQVDGDQSRSFRGRLRNAIRSVPTWRGFYQGLAPNFLGSTVAWGSYFLFYAIDKSYRLKRSQTTTLTPSQHLMAAAEAGALTAIITNPLWLLKTRMCIDGGEQYATLSNACRTIWKAEGIAGFYKGFFPSLFGVSHGAVQFMVYEEMKIWRQRYYQERDGLSFEQSKHLSTTEYILMAAFSKAVATIVTYPYQVVRAKIQDHRGITQYLGVRDVLTKIWKKERVAGFYRGLLPNIIRVLPGTCITFATYETVLRFLS